MSEIIPPSDGPSGGNNKWIRGLINAIGGAIPIAGGVVTAGAGVWGEAEQERANAALQAWIKMLEDELKEKQATMAQIIVRLDLHDEQIADRIRSDEYQSLLKKAFRNWAGTESRKKQEYIRNILTNAAATALVSDDVVSLFIDWLHTYSEFHFAVIGEIYRAPTSTRSEIWESVGKGDVREDSAEADLFKLLIRDLSTGGIIRQQRETDHAGNFVARRPQRSPSGSSKSQKVMKSAFDDSERYVLTALGEKFVHYAMTELTTKIAYTPSDTEGENATPEKPIEGGNDENKIV